MAINKDNNTWMPVSDKQILEFASGRITHEPNIE